MPETRFVKAQVGTHTIRIEATQLGGEQEISASRFDFEEICDALSGFIDAIQNTLQKATPQKTTVEFGVEIGAEAGHLTALIVKGSATANLKITLEWG